jgi:hypothetical protein
MDLVKGDWEDLKGEVIAYSKYLSPNDNIISFASIATHDLNHFSLEHCISQEKKQQLELKAKMSRKDTGDRGNLVFFYGTEMIGMEEAEILSSSSDILYVGQSVSTARADFMLKLGLSYYFVQFEEQFNIKNPSVEYQRKKYEHYSMFNGDLYSFLFDAYTVPMIELGRNKDEESKRKLAELKLGLIRFCKGTNFFDDAKFICSLVRPGEHSDETLIEEILTKIRAVHQEDYLVAAKSRDRIAELSFYLNPLNALLQK